MTSILPEITSLLQHIKTLKADINSYRPKCFNCGRSGLWKHGSYGRKSDRSGANTSSLNPITIPRFFCPYCNKTTSVLPECIAPHRWYIWEVQQAIFLQMLLGKSLRKVSKATSISRSTCRRWWNSFKERYLLHGSTLRSYFPSLGRYTEFHDFWNACLSNMALSKAMLLCHQSGVKIP